MLADLLSCLIFISSPAGEPAPHCSFHRRGIRIKGVAWIIQRHAKLPAFRQATLQMKRRQHCRGATEHNEHVTDRGTQHNRATDVTAAGPQITQLWFLSVSLRSSWFCDV